MIERLRAAMRSFETGGPLSSDVWAPALAGLGSKYLAVGAPQSLGLIGCGEQDEAMQMCHELLFGSLQVRRDQEWGVEDALACDIVCMASEVEFQVSWIADGTHLNLCDTGRRSPASQELLRSAPVTTHELPGDGIAQVHGSLLEVIHGTVSGRMGDELTVLLYPRTW